MFVVVVLFILCKFENDVEVAEVVIFNYFFSKMGVQIVMDVYEVVVVVFESYIICGDIY